MSNLWWHNIPHCKLGDLVRYSSYRGRLKEPMLVIKVNPKKPCRVNPVQYVTVLKCSNSRTSTFEATKLEVISESR